MPCGRGAHSLPRRGRCGSAARGTAASCADAGASREQVLRAIPAKGRLTDRLSRIYSSLERDLNVLLSDEQKALVFAADGERKQALKDLPAQAAAK